jgi:hypothetical protein
MAGHGCCEDGIHREGTFNLGLKGQHYITREFAEAYSRGMWLCSGLLYSMEKVGLCYGVDLLLTRNLKRTMIEFHVIYLSKSIA